MPLFITLRYGPKKLPPLLLCIYVFAEIYSHTHAQKPDNDRARGYSGILIILDSTTDLYFDCKSVDLVGPEEEKDTARYWILLVRIAEKHL